MNIYSFPAIAAFVVNLSTAFIVFFANTRSAVNRWTSVLVLSFAVWNISEIFILASGTEQGATLAAQIIYRVLFLMPAIYVALAYHSRDRPADPRGACCSTSLSSCSLQYFWCLHSPIFTSSSFLSRGRAKFTITESCCARISSRSRY